MENINKFLYGFLFIVILPLLLIYWAIMTSAVITLPVPLTPLWGGVLALVGFLILFTGMITLMIVGKGLPMNASPPPRYVNRGIYRLVPHPIYVGFSLLCAGLSIFYESPSGLWLVTPAVMLGSVAIVLGYEKPDLIERFGNTITKPLLRLPANVDTLPPLSERISVYILVLLPWLLLYEAFVSFGISPQSFALFFPFEKTLPVLEWTELIYGATYLMVLVVPLIARTSRSLRAFSLAGITGMVIGFLLFILLPVISPPRYFIPDGLWGRILLLEQGYDTAGAAFPSFHAFWAVISAGIFTHAFPRLKYVWWMAALLICLSCVTTGMHAIIDVVAGIVLGLLSLRYKQVWEWLRASTERVANSWHEWRIGSVRIINHGAYTGAGAMMGYFIATTLLGPGSIWFAFIVAISSLICAGLWAQIVEGSSALLRPYGYYGGVIGIIIGSVIAHLFGMNGWLLASAYAVAGPLIQAAGRFRCLIQGCCHGHPAPDSVGIRYTHPRSRVCRLSEYTGVPLHPTQLYSILWNIISGVLLIRLWIIQVPPTFIVGMYLLLNGLGRFVEESYRGEPQTPILRKLRLYQLLSIASVLLGIVVSTLSTTAAYPAPEFSWSVVCVSIVVGLSVWFAQGVDFPGSNKRFSRLT